MNLSSEFPGSGETPQQVGQLMSAFVSALDGSDHQPAFNQNLDYDGPAPG